MLSMTSPILFPIVLHNRNATLPSDTKKKTQEAKRSQRPLQAQAQSYNLVSFLLCRLIANNPCKSASVKPDWKHKPGSRPFVEPI